MEAVAVEAVVEASAACSDAGRAQAALADALASSRAPRRGRGERWTVTVRVSRLSGGTGPKSADASITDDAGDVVSQRTLTDRADGACAPLARAIGAWATLVIDSELTRAHDEPPGPSEPAPRKVDEAAPVRAQAGPAPAIGDPDRPAPPPRTGNVEIGGAMYLRGGLGEGGIAGVSPFVTVEVARSWLLRPSAALGRSTSGELTQIGARLDFCRRIPGNYIDRRGLEADVCGGGDVGLLAGAPYLALGPAMALRGELGGGFAVELRGGVGANVVRYSRLAEASRAAATGEAQLGVSGRLP